MEPVVFTDPLVTETRPRRHWRFWLLLIGIPLLTLALSGVAWMVRANVGLQSAIAEADRLDPRWRLEEIEADRVTPPPGENGADKIVAIKRLWPARPWPDYKNTQLFDDLPSMNRLNDAQIAALNELLEPAGPALAEARSLIDTPRGRHPVTYTPDWFNTLLPTLQSSRDAVTLLKFDALNKAEAGDIDGAIRTCHAAFHAGCSIGDEPSLIAQLVRIACQAAAINLLERALAQGEPSDAVLTALQARIEATETEPLLLYGLRGERAGYYQFFEAIRSGTLPTKSAVATLGTPPELEYLFFSVPGFILLQQTSHLHYMTELVVIAKLPPEKWAGAFADQKAKVGELPVVVKALVPATDKMGEAFRRNYATLRCAIVAIAAERYRRQNGRWPVTPEELVKAGLLKSVPKDPFAAGQSIKFAHPADGLIVYSTGQDGKDDGGKLNPDARKAGFDVGFRLWDVASRRQPPLPPKVETP
jgi:hypothetical protein